MRAERKREKRNQKYFEVGRNKSYISELCIVIEKYRRFETRNNKNLFIIRNLFNQIVFAHSFNHKIKGDIVVCESYPG